MNNNSKILMFIFILIITLNLAQDSNRESYKEISGLMEAYAENDGRAFILVNAYIKKAKSENNSKRLIKGYENAVYYSAKVDEKLVYADSALTVALQIKDTDQISRAYLGKGIIYFYNRRQFTSALQQYLLAHKFSRNSKDDYLKNKIVYHLGLVKSYLGYYAEAAVHFKTSADYCENKLKHPSHPNLRFNDEKGYFNSIYRLSTCYKNLHRFDDEDSLIQIGLKGLEGTQDHLLEYAYFQKGKGVQLLRKGFPAEALKYLETSKKILHEKQDYASLTNIYFYIGRLHEMDNDRENALQYFRKVDSLVSRYWFITPETRANYMYLIADAKRNADARNQIYYQNQLSRADSIINADFAVTSSKIYQEYDADILLQASESKINRLHHSLSWLYIAVAAGVLFTAAVIGVLIRRKKMLNRQYAVLLRNYNSAVARDYSSLPAAKTTIKNCCTPEAIQEVCSKLKIFEEKKLFLKPNISLQSVAKTIGTNRTHLSHVINEHLQMTFPLYIKTLRIGYITEKMMTDQKYLNYKIGSLALECGIINRQVFSTHFLEINGIRPADFIQKRKEELGKKP